MNSSSVPIKGHRAKGILFVLLGASLWGASGVAAQYLLHDKLLSPEWLVAVRLLSAGFLLLCYDFIKSSGDIFTIWKNRQGRNQLLCFGIFGMLSVQYTFFAAILHGNAATATILQYLMPVIIVCYFTLRDRSLPKALELFSIFLAMLGTSLLVTKGDLGNLAISPLALFWGIASAFSAAFYTVQPKYLLSHWRSPLVIGWGMLIGGIALSPINPPWQFIGIWDFSTALGVLFIILFGTIIAFCAYLESIKYIQATETGTIASVEPLTAVFLSIYLLNVPFSWMEGIGALCIMSTVFILAKIKK